jgi:Xaa-Pro aminopeptidase
MGHETHLQMPLDNFNLLNKNLRINWHDTTPIIRQLRMIKSEAEISLIKRICDIASRSFDKIPEISSVGQPLSELFRSFKIDLLNEGADDIPYLVGGVGEPSYSDVISPPTGRRLSLGETVMLDTGAVYKGYYCDFNRNFAIGEPPSSVKKAYETLWKTTETALDYIRPGVSTSNLFQLMSNTLQTSSSDVGRFGHGLGMQLTEWPSIANWDQTELVKNMVITLEPSIHVDGGGVLVTEENIVVRDGRPELLSKRAFRDIPIIGLP